MLNDHLLAWGMQQSLSSSKNTVPHSCTTTTTPKQTQVTCFHLSAVQRRGLQLYKYNSCLYIIWTLAVNLCSNLKLELLMLFVVQFFMEFALFSSKSNRHICDCGMCLSLGPRHFYFIIWLWAWRMETWNWKLHPYYFTPHVTCDCEKWQCTSRFDASLPSVTPESNVEINVHIWSKSVKVLIRELYIK